MQRRHFAWVHTMILLPEYIQDKGTSYSIQFIWGIIAHSYNNVNNGLVCW